jgi:hypothetical protein
MMKRILLVNILLLPVMTAGATCDRLYTGLYRWGAEVNTFQPCGSDTDSWVSASTWILGPLKAYLQQHTGRPYQPVYIEMRGHLLDEETGGFASQYDGLVRISEVIRKDTKIPAGCEQPARSTP